MAKLGPPQPAVGAKRARRGLDDSQLPGDATAAGDPQPAEAAAAKPAGNADAPGAKKRGESKAKIAQYTRVERLCALRACIDCMAL